jgi:predicted ATPase
LDSAEISKISDQFKAGQWPQFLEMVEIAGLRGWSGQAVNFTFPVVAVVGENGTGKSTLLKAAACAYENTDASKTFYPSRLFLNTRWDTIQGVSLKFRVKLGNENRSFEINKPTKRWSFPEKRVVRDVFIFDISRTLPLDASAGYAKIARLAAAEVSTTQISKEYTERLSHVLGRDYKNARFATSDVDSRRQVGLLTREFGEVSQFHQGAGEDATLDLFRTIQGIPSNSLLIIDEVEASLHPRAQRRLVRFLMWLSRHKRIQVVISTHSPYVLEELPLEANVLLLPGPAGLSVVYGASPEFALSRIDENVHPELVIFVEDREAITWLREIIASDPRGPQLLSRLAISAVGPANVVKMLGSLASQGRLPYKKALAIQDGEQDAIEGCENLPGSEPPEVIVLNGLKSDGFRNLPERFGVGAGDLFTYLEDALLEPDPHRWTAMVGDKVLKSSSSVWETLCNQWCKLPFEADSRRNIVDKVAEVLG